MSDSDTPLRQQLDDAIDKVRRELEIVRFPTNVGGGADNREVIAELENELQQLVEARGHVGPHET